MKGKIVRGIAGMAAAVLAVISVNGSVFAQDTGTVLLSYPELTEEDTGTVLSSYPELTDEKENGEIPVDDLSDIEQVVSPDQTDDISLYINTEKKENASSVLDTILAKKDIMAVVFLTDECKVYCEPDTDSEVVTHISEGETVYINGTEFSENKNAMFLVSTFVDGTEFKGYVEAKNLIYSDEDLKEWADEYLAENGITPDALSEKTDDGIPDEVKITDDPAEGTSLYSTTYEEIDRFPYSYRAKLTALKSAHPNWFFVPMNTGLDFNTAVSNEMGDKMGRKCHRPGKMGLRHSGRCTVPYGSQKLTYGQLYFPV